MTPLPYLLRKGRKWKTGSVDNPKFKIKIEGRPILDLQTVLHGVQNDMLTIDGLSGRLMGTDYPEILNSRVGHDLNMCNEEESRHIPHVTVYSTYQHDVHNILDLDIGLKPDEIGISVDSLPAYFESRNIKNSVNTVIVLPIYAKLNERGESNEASVLAEAEVHYALLNQVQFKISKSGSGTV